MKKHTSRILVALVVVTLAGSPLWAATQARVAGKVTDSAGQPIAGATITITCPELTNYIKELETDKKGRYKVLLLDATKRYKFFVTAEGYGPRERNVKVGVGSMDNEINFTLANQQEIMAAQEDQLRALPGFKEYDEGQELLAQGDKDAARAKFQEAVVADPELVRAWMALAEVDYDLGDYETAHEHAVSCLELDEESSACLAVAANSCNKLGKIEEHAEYMARYQAINPDDPATLFNQAVEHLNAMDDEQARPFLEQCLDVDADFPKCVYEYGMLLLRSGDLEGAKAQLEHYLEVAPDGEDAATVQETVKYL
jgi:tetratricopeptide (TPR) repeat protein